jgi:hypothetical protein
VTFLIDCLRRDAREPVATARFGEKLQMRWRGKKKNYFKNFAIAVYKM